jgi:hypothetical protein
MAVFLYTICITYVISTLFSWVDNDLLFADVRRSENDSLSWDVPQLLCSEVKELLRLRLALDGFSEVRRHFRFK